MHNISHLYYRIHRGVHKIYTFFSTIVTPVIADEKGWRHWTKQERVYRKPVIGHVMHKVPNKVHTQSRGHLSWHDYCCCFCSCFWCFWNKSTLRGL